MTEKKENKFSFQPRQLDKQTDLFAKDNLRSQNPDIQNLIDMCTKKLEKEPTHKKALLIRASSFIKKNSLDEVTVSTNQ
jgi:hypothetical protein